MEHFRIDHLKDIVLLDQGVDMIFGGFNAGQYAKKYIYQRGESVERFDLECKEALWQELAETFGGDVIVMRRAYKRLTVKVSAVPSVMRDWVMIHMSDCEVLGPKRFRDEIQRMVLEAYRKYWG